jgi:hypothetical protein
MYVLVYDSLFKRIVSVTNEMKEGIPFDPANTDYQQFKIQVADGTPLEDPEGNVMTQDEVDAFLKTIP